MSFRLDTASGFRAALDHLDLSHAETARRLQVHRNAVYYWANGKRPVPGPVQAALTAWLEAPVRADQENG